MHEAYRRRRDAALRTRWPRRRTAAWCGPEGGMFVLLDVRDSGARLGGIRRKSCSRARAVAVLPCDGFSAPQRGRPSAHLADRRRCPPQGRAGERIVRLARQLAGRKLAGRRVPAEASGIKIRRSVLRSNARSSEVRTIAVRTISGSIDLDDFRWLQAVRTGVETPTGISSYGGLPAGQCSKAPAPSMDCRKFCLKIEAGLLRGIVHVARHGKIHDGRPCRPARRGDLSDGLSTIENAPSTLDLKKDRTAGCAG